MDDDELDLVYFETQDDGCSWVFTPDADSQDETVAYYAGRESVSLGTSEDDCPYSKPEARHEWFRGREDAERSAMSSMRRGMAPDSYRDPY
jgi:ribosome modulation factor